ncbi:hypothetical protein QYF61_007866 [Mycteria americana]|uniref:ribonuclease H n=1 Tax=Mycteria americana TaxID=33587 RepID=A0AAN7S658_MYCAM|nr:hypothetical protein QYF61_007866 [Mycteria americana]
MAALDVKDMFFMISLREDDKSQFAFTWEESQYTFNRLLQGYKHSPTIAHNALAALLGTVKVASGVHIYQYIDDIPVGGENKGQAGQVGETMWNLLMENRLDIPPSKCQGPRQEIQFLGAWWIAGTITVPDDVLSAIEGEQTPNSKTELQHLLGTLGYWRNHIPGFLVIARPLYDFLRKNRTWDWTPRHTEALNVLKDELKTYQKLGPLHP